MEKRETREFWLRGPVPGIRPLLQPIAHALLQAREEVTTMMEGFPAEKIWQRPAEAASPGFHLQHLAGVLDRLFTYANGLPLDRSQLDYLAMEGKPPEGTFGQGAPSQGINTVPALVERFRRQVDRALEQLAATPETALTEPRGVGRAQIPSTVGGLLFHAAEHTQRHTGQLLVTIKVLLGEPTGNPWEHKGV